MTSSKRKQVVSGIILAVVVPIIFFLLFEGCMPMDADSPAATATALSALPAVSLEERAPAAPRISPNESE